MKKILLFVLSLLLLTGTCMAAERFEKVVEAPDNSFQCYIDTEDFIITSSAKDKNPHVIITWVKTIFTEPIGEKGEVKSTLTHFEMDLENDTITILENAYYSPDGKLLGREVPPEKVAKKLTKDAGETLFWLCTTNFLNNHSNSELEKYIVPHK